MTTRTLSLQLEEDFTTHTAALFVSHVNVFQSTIRIIAGERSINAKSLLGVVSFGFRQGQQVQVAADGRSRSCKRVVAIFPVFCFRMTCLHIGDGEEPQ